MTYMGMTPAGAEVWCRSTRREQAVLRELAQMWAQVSDLDLNMLCRTVDIEGPTGHNIQLVFQAQTERLRRLVDRGARKEMTSDRRS